MDYTSQTLAVKADVTSRPVQSKSASSCTPFACTSHIMLAHASRRQQLPRSAALLCSSGSAHVLSRACLSLIDKVAPSECQRLLLPQAKKFTRQNSGGWNDRSHGDSQNKHLCFAVLFLDALQALLVQDLLVCHGNRLCLSQRLCLNCHRVHKVIVESAACNTD